VSGRLPTRILLAVGVCVGGFCAAACDEQPARQPLQHTRASARSLAEAAVDAVARRDAATLRSLALSEQEFREYVWPELPASRPDRNLPFSFVWGDLNQKSEAALRTLLSVHGGRRYAVIDVRFAGGATHYQSFIVHRETTLRIRDEQGVDGDVRLYGSTFQKEGAFKIFSYVVD
jgi:hypothetical protein